MNKAAKKSLSILLACLMLLPSVVMMFPTVPYASASEETVTLDLEDIIDGQNGKVDVSADDEGNLSMNFRDMPDKPLLEYNENDAKVDVGENLSYAGSLGNTGMGLYKVGNTANVHLVESGVKSESEAENYLNACLEHSVMTSNEISHFIALGDALATGNIIGMDEDFSAYETNKTSKMRIVNESNSATEDIIVLDDDAIAIFVKDTDENNIENASVTVRYKDSAGVQKTRAIKTNRLGAAIFDDMKGVYFTSVDIQHENYRSKTILNAEIEPGKAIFKYLEPKQENDLYIRCADLDGLDMTEYADEITVSGADLFKQDLTYTVIVSKSGNRVLPETINITAENAGSIRVVSTLKKYESVYSDQNTAAYISKANWVSDKFFKNGDVICYDLDPSGAGLKNGPGASVKSGATVTDAKTSTPIWTNTNYGFFNGMASYTFDKDVPGIGGTSIGFEAFKCPLSIAVLPDGSVYMSYGLSLVDEGKPEDMVSATWNPSKANQTKGFFKKAHDEFLNKVAQFREGKDLFVNQGAGVWTGKDSFEKVKVDLIFSALGNYDKETKRVAVTFSVILSVTGSFGMTWYVMIPVGPMAIPAYGGFNAGATGQFAGALTLSMDISKSSVTDMLSSIQLDMKKESDASAALDIILSLSAYVGVGLHDLACVQFTGNVYMDIGLDLASSAMVEYNKYTPRFKITGGYSVDASATFMWFKAKKTFWSDRGWVYDSWGIYGEEPKQLLLSASDTEIIPIDLDASQSQLTKLESNGANDTEQYKLKPSLKSPGNSETTLIDSKTLNAGSPRFVLTKNYAALFRMMTIDGSVRLVYQLMTFDGTLSDVVNVLPIPTTYISFSRSDVVEYDVIADGDNGVSVTAIYADGSKMPAELKATRSYVLCYRIDFSRNGNVTTKIIRNYGTSRGAVYTNPVAISDSDDPMGGFCETDIKGSFRKYTVAVDDGRHDQSVELNSSDDIIYSQNLRSGDDFIYFYKSKQEGDVFTFKAARDISVGGGTPISISFNYKDITGKSWDGKTPLIQSYTTVGGKIFVIIGGKVCLLSTRYSRTLIPLEGENGKEFTLPDTADDFDIREGADGSICITALSVNYDENGNASGSTFYVYRIIENSRKNLIIHGPQEIKLDAVNPSSFTAIPDSPTGACIAFYTKPLPEQTTSNGVTDAAELYQWTQSPFAQANVKAMAFTKSYIAGTDNKVPFNITVKNNGTNHLESVNITLFGDKTQKLSSKTYPVDLYPGDEVVLDFSDTPRPSNWTSGIHSMSARTDIEGSDIKGGVLNDTAQPDDMYTVTFDSSYLMMDIDKKFVNGNERAFVTITNKSMVSAQTPVLQLVGKFKNDGERVIKTIEIPAMKLTEADIEADGSVQGIRYNTSFNLSEIWDKYDVSEEVLYGVTARLMPRSAANDNLTSAEADAIGYNMPSTKYFANPNLNRVVEISAGCDNSVKGTVIGSGIYNVGDTVTLEVIPNENFSFIGWYDGDKLISNDRTISFNASENIRYTAKFVPSIISVTLKDMRMNRNTSAPINITVEADEGVNYTVEYISSAPDIVSVDNNGKLTAHKNGSAEISCIVTDENGNIIRNSCAVSVRFSLVEFIRHIFERLKAIFKINIKIDKIESVC